jgi:hypothetical protein
MTRQADLVEAGDSDVCTGPMRRIGVTARATPLYKAMPFPLSPKMDKTYAVVFGTRNSSIETGLG